MFIILASQLRCLMALVTEKSAAKKHGRSAQKQSVKSIEHSRPIGLSDSKPIGTFERRIDMKKAGKANKDVSMKTHWEGIYKTKSPVQVSWFKPHLEKSLELINKSGIDHEAHIIDIGGGASTLVDDLLKQGYPHVTVLDISAQAIDISKQRLGKFAGKVEWIAADITKAKLPQNAYDLWHDRAVFHFLTHERDRAKYIAALNHSLKPCGHLVMATFGLNGPLKCSGLDIARYSLPVLLDELGSNFTPLEELTETHLTPFQTKQEFLYGLFRKN